MENEINRLRMMGLNGCDILIIIIAYKRTGIEIVELAYAFAKLGSQHLKSATEEMKKLGNVIIERPFIDIQFGEKPLIVSDEKFRKHQQKLAVRHFKWK